MLATLQSCQRICQGQLRAAGHCWPPRAQKLGSGEADFSKSWSREKPFCMRQMPEKAVPQRSFWENCLQERSTRSSAPSIDKDGICSKMASGPISSVQSLSCVQLCDPMNRSTLGLPVHHQLPEFTQTQVHRVGDAIQPSHPLSSPSPPAPNPSQHQSLFQ